MTVTANEPSTHTPGLAIHEVSRTLQVPAPTLRSWERRYGIPVATRSAGGHRRYQAGELTQLRLMRDEIARGKRAGDAALSVRVLLDQDNPAQPWILRLLTAAGTMDAVDVRRVLEVAHEELGLAATVDQVLMPTMRQVGAWWEAGRCDMAQEHLMTEIARGWLARLTVLAPVSTYESSILLACGPRDQHTMGLEALAALLAEEGRACRILGARTSELTLVSAARTSETAALVVASQLHTHRRSTVAALRVVDQTGCPLFFAGNAFAFPADRVGVPGTYLGDSLSEARRIILDSSIAGGSGAPQQVA